MSSSAHFPGIATIKYEGPESTNTLAFKYYNADEVIMGKKMSEWMRFAVCWWHTFNGGMGTDPFSSTKTHLRTWDKNMPNQPAQFHKDSAAEKAATLEIFKERVDVAFEFFQKLGNPYYCFHDVDVAPQGDSLEEFEKNLDLITDLMLKKQKETGIKCLWVTQNLFSHPRYKDGAGTAPGFDSFSFACWQVKKCLDIGKKLGAENHVFWGGREGFQTPLNTNVRQELDNFANLLKMAVAYKKKIGHTTQLLIEPKPREPCAHQYDYDAQTVIGFLRTYDLQDHFKLNIEPNHTTLAGHDYEHDLRMSSEFGMLGSIDCNAGQPYLGWDTDEFPSDPRKALLSMLIIVKQGGIAPGGNNFDCKLRRESSDLEDMFVAHIGGMDCLARGLRGAEKMIKDDLFASNLKKRYLSWETEPLAKKVKTGGATLEEIAAHATTLKEPVMKSGKQEYLEQLLNKYI